MTFFSSMFINPDALIQEALGFLEDKTDPENLPKLRQIMNEATGLYEDGDLTSSEVDRLMKKALPYVREDERGEVERLYQSNRHLIRRFL